MAVAGTPDRAGGRGRGALLLGPARVGQLALAGLVAAALAPLGGCVEEGLEPAGGGNGAAPRGARPALVVGVSDGDTISLAGLGRVRLIGIDTPEVHGGAECFGARASAFVRGLLPAGTRVRYRLGIEPRDRYGRALAYVWLADGRLLNALLVERGYAQPLTVPPNVELAGRFATAARRARRRRLGLWGVRGCADGEGDTRGGARRCSDFETQAEAQRWFRRRAGGRPDGDGDGRVCESLP